MTEPKKRFWLRLLLLVAALQTFTGTIQGTWMMYRELQAHLPELPRDQEFEVAAQLMSAAPFVLGGVSLAVPIALLVWAIRMK